MPSIDFGEKDRQVGYTETDDQHRERIAFLKQRENARRVANWIQESAVRVANVSTMIFP